MGSYELSWVSLEADVVSAGQGPQMGASWLQNSSFCCNMSNAYTTYQPSSGEERGCKMINPRRKGHE